MGHNFAGSFASSFVKIHLDNLMELSAIQAALFSDYNGNGGVALLGE